MLGTSQSPVAANRPVQLSALDDIPPLATRSWVPFSLLELHEALKACSNISAPGPDHITWRYLKYILADDVCAAGILSSQLLYHLATLAPALQGVGLCHYSQAR